MYMFMWDAGAFSSPFSLVNVHLEIFLNQKEIPFLPTNVLQFFSCRFCVKFAETLASCSTKVKCLSKAVLLSPDFVFLVAFS